MELNLPVTIVLIVAGVVVLGIVGILVRRSMQRPPASGADQMPTTTEGGGIDYTSMPISDEPRNWRERFAGLSLPAKILIGVVPLLLIVLIVVVQQLLTPAPAPPPPTPTPIPAKISIESAKLASGSSIRIHAITDQLPNDTEVRAELSSDGAPFLWFDPEKAKTKVAKNDVSIVLRRAENAPLPTRGAIYTVTLLVDIDGKTISDTLGFSPTGSFAEEFYTGGIVAQPPTASPTNTPPAVATTPTVTTTAELTPTPGTSKLQATVFNGGNVRNQPVVGNNIVDQINATETVQLIERSADGAWYHIINMRKKEGWVSASLLTIDPTVVSLVPIFGRTPPTTGTPTTGTPTAGTLSAIVFHGGNVRQQRTFDPNNVVDQINAGEKVDLLARSGDGNWYQIRNIRAKEGWVSVSLLTVAPDVAAKVRVIP